VIQDGTVQIFRHLFALHIVLECPDMQLVAPCDDGAVEITGVPDLQGPDGILRERGCESDQNFTP
jgi:hypothetical protein